jgi:hypothetical protein
MAGSRWRPKAKPQTSHSILIYVKPGGRGGEQNETNKPRILFRRNGNLSIAVATETKTPSKLRLEKNSAVAVATEFQFDSLRTPFVELTNGGRGGDQNSTLLAPVIIRRICKQRSRRRPFRHPT